MNKRQARLFAVGSTVAACVAFAALTLDSHRQFDTLTHADKITAEVKRGKDAWHKNNCINCHTVFGEGAYYAPDLTKITKLRGAAYLSAYLRDPSKFYDETRHRRLMPKQDLSERDIADLIAFLDWVANVDNQNWPPRPILVTGAAFPLAAEAAAPAQVSSASAGASDPILLGERLFRGATPACVACHSVAPGVNLAGPSLAGLAARTATLLASGTYGGKAKDLAGYIGEAIRQPSAHLVPGAMYSANGVSFMPTTYAKDLTAQQIDQLAAYLSSLK